MIKILSNKLFIGFCISVLTIGFLFVYAEYKEKKSLSLLESRVIPIILRKNVAKYGDWPLCKVLRFDGREVSDPTGCFSQKETNQFTEEDWKLFNIIYQALKATPKKFSSFSMRNDGSISFEIDCRSCRRSYIYDPGYVLPSNHGDDAIYSPVNNKWYDVLGDWP